MVFSHVLIDCINKELPAIHIDGGADEKVSDGVIIPRVRVGFRADVGDAFELFDETLLLQQGRERIAARVGLGDFEYLGTRANEPAKDDSKHSRRTGSWI